MSNFSIRDWLERGIDVPYTESDKLAGKMSTRNCVCGHPESEHVHEDTCDRDGCECDNYKPRASAPTRPALRYYGGKWNLAPWIISHFPPHTNYVEPCGGAASVLLQKPRSPLETYNDIDGNVVNFFRVLRERPNELIRAIRLTPWARAEFEMSLETTQDHLEAARRFFVCLWMGRRGSIDTTKGQVSFHADHDSRAKQMPYQDLEWFSDRLYGVQVENLPALEIIRKYDNARALFYVDPPYLHGTRIKTNVYLEEWDDGQHVLMADALKRCAGFVVVSGYASTLYHELFEVHGWERRDKVAQTDAGTTRTESIWLSPRTWQTLQSGAGLPMFSQEIKS